MTDPNQCEAAAWGSHLPALFAAIGRSSGPVLELGIGHFSTPVLHALCGALGRELWSVEDNSEWSDHFIVRYPGYMHRFICEEYPSAIQKLIQKNWGVVFIDHSPGGANRATAFEAFRDISEFIVVHDYHLENEVAIAPMLDGMNCHVTTTYQPPTLIFSRISEIPHSILCL